MKKRWRIDDRRAERSEIPVLRSAPGGSAESDPRERIARPAWAAGPGKTRRWSPPENDRSCVH